MRLPAPNSLISPYLSDTIVELRARITTVSQEAVTGRHADLSRHLSGRIGEALLSQQAVSDIAGQRSILDLRQTRLDLTQSSLTHIQDVSSGIGTRLEAALGLGDQHATDLAANDAAAALRQVFSALNVRHGERYLFSGDATATLPLNDPDTLMADLRTLAVSAPDAAAFNTSVAAYFNDPAGPWQQGIYAGSTAASDADALLATDPALTGLISGLAVLALARPQENLALIDNNPGILNGSARTLQNAETALTALRSDRGVIQERLAQDLSALNLEETICHGPSTA